MGCWGCLPPAPPFPNLAPCAPGPGLPSRRPGTLSDRGIAACTASAAPLTPPRRCCRSPRRLHPLRLHQRSLSHHPAPWLLPQSHQAAPAAQQHTMADSWEDWETEEPEVPLPPGAAQVGRGVGRRGRAVLLVTLAWCRARMPGLRAVRCCLAAQRCAAATAAVAAASVLALAGRQWSPAARHPPSRRPPQPTSLLARTRARRRSPSGRPTCRSRRRCVLLPQCVRALPAAPAGRARLAAAALQAAACGSGG